MVLPVARYRTNQKLDLSGILFIELDNLEVLEGLDTNSIDCVYMDPPFKNNGEIYQGSGSDTEIKWRDLWTWDDVHDIWWDGIKSKYKAVAACVESIRQTDPKQGAYAASMAARLLELKRVVKPNGVIVIHCDPDISTSGRIFALLPSDRTAS